MFLYSKERQITTIRTRLQETELTYNIYKLDLIWGYNNIQIKEDNKWKITFFMNKGLFKPKVIYFGL